MKGRKALRVLAAAFAVAMVVGLAVIPVGAAKRTVTVWCWDYQKKCIEASLPRFYAANPDIQIEFVIKQPADLYSNLLMALNAGTGGPDVAGMESSHLTQFVETNQLLDITDKAGKYLNKFNHAKWADATLKGKIYAMPWDSGPVALWYRRDVFEKAGYKSDPDSVAKLLNTWDDYYKVAKVIKQKTGKFMFAFAKANNDARIFEMLMWQKSMWYINKSGKVTLDDPKNIRVFEYLAKFWKEDLAEDTVPWTPGWYAGMAEGNVATIIEAVWMGGFLTGWIAPDAVGKWGVVPLPIWAAGDPRTANDGGSTLVITKQVKDKEAAWKFIEFITADMEAQVAAWRVADSFPALEAAYNSPLAAEKSDYFGGQAYRALFCKLAKDVPAIQYTKDYVEANAITMAEIAACALGKKTPAQALKDAAALIRERTHRP